MKQTIDGIVIADFCEEGTTVSVSVVSEKGKEETFHVQTVDSVYRSDLGCWILTNDSDGEINLDDYPDFDFSEIIDAAEKFIQNEIKEEWTDYKINNEWVYLLISSLKIKVVIRNDNFINKDTSSYQREFSEPVAEFDTREEALKWLKEKNEE